MNGGGNIKKDMDKDEALAIIRAEILAQDWRLPPRRLARLSAALASCAGIAATRRGFSYIHSMAVGIISYLERHGDAAAAGAVDLLKECLAHLLALFEGRDISPAREARAFHGAYGRFVELKRKIRQKAET